MTFNKIEPDLPQPSYSSDEVFDVAIIGGGVNGTSIARELALRGFKVILFEKKDFASGTSSCSSKLMHGGLRYLEHGQLGLVFESCQERELALQHYPHLVQPLPFLIPIYPNSKWPRWKLRLGLMTYDILSLFKQTKTHKWYKKDALLEKEPTLYPNGLTGAFCYYDALMNDSRICLELALQAKSLGAEIYNYLEVTSMEKRDDYYMISINDAVFGLERTILSKFVVNTSGPWSDILIKRVYPQHYPVLRPSKGIHIITKSLTHSHALLLTTPQDNRVFFIIPWEGLSLIGTTDTDYNQSPDKLSITKKDIDYLLTAVNFYFPKHTLSRSDIISSYAGIRPLVNAHSSCVSDVSRKEKVIDHAFNFISLIGGKFTTFRRVGETLARLISKRLYPQFSFFSLTKSFPLYSGTISNIDDFMTDNYAKDCKICSITKPSYRHLVSCYGHHYKSVLHILTENEQYIEPLHATHHLKGEVIYAIRFEMAQFIDDFMRRRTHISLKHQHGLDCLNQIADLFQQELAWSDKKKQEQIGIYKALHSTPF